MEMPHGQSQGPRPAGKQRMIDEGNGVEQPEEEESLNEEVAQTINGEVIDTDSDDSDEAQKDKEAEAEQIEKEEILAKYENTKVRYDPDFIKFTKISVSQKIYDVTFEVRIKLSTKVKKFKKLLYIKAWKLANRLKVKVQQQKLWVKNRLMDDDMTLDYYGLNDLSIITLNDNSHREQFAERHNQKILKR